MGEDVEIQPDGTVVVEDEVKDEKIEDKKED